MDSPRGILLFILLLFLLLAPDPQQFNLRRHQDSTRTLETEKYGLELLANSRYGDFDPDGGKWLNITGLREEDGFAWEALKSVQRDVSNELHSLLGWPMAEQVAQAGAAEANGSPSKTDLLVYKNITGTLKGTWMRSVTSYKLHLPQFNMTTPEGEGEFMTSRFTNNVTGVEGDIQIRLDERKGEQLGRQQGMVREVTATMAIQDYDSSGDSRELRLHGVHYQEYGSAVLTTSSGKYVSICGWVGKSNKLTSSIGFMACLPYLILHSRKTHLISQRNF